MTRLLFCVLIIGLSATTWAQESWRLSLSAGFGNANTISDDENAAIRFSGDNAFQLVANYFDSVNYDGANLHYELLFSQTNLNLDTENGDDSAIQGHHLQLGGVYEWAEWQYVQPYLAGTLGASHYDSEYDSGELFWSSSFALGTHIRLNSAVALKLEARALGTLLNGNLGVFCNEQNCSLGVDGNLWWQHYVSAGFSWSF